MGSGLALRWAKAGHQVTIGSRDAARAANVAGELSDKAGEQISGTDNASAAMIGELVAVVLMCALISLMFFGGWLSPVPGLPDGIFWMVAKMGFVFFFFAMVKAITPRYRYDQLMRLGWKVFLPFSLVWVVFVAFAAKFGWFWGIYARWTVGG